MPEVVARDVTGGSSTVSAQPQNNQIDTNVGQSQPIKEEVRTQEEALSPRFAALARQQKAIRAQQMAFEGEKKQIAEERAAIETQRQEIEQAKAWKQRLAQDPYGVMLETGLTADQVATLMLNQPNPDTQRVLLLEQEIKALKAAQEQTTTKFDDAQKQQYAEAVKQIRNDVLMTVDGDQNFETIKAMNAQDAVVELIEATFHENGRLMGVEEAAKEVEDYLVEEAMKIAALGKIRSRLNPPAPPVQKQQVQQKQSPQTLSNRMVQSTSKPTTDRERKERAIAAFMGNTIR